MKHLCAGFVRLRKAERAWAPCGRIRAKGDRFCQEHRDSLDGAILGLFHSIEPSDGKREKRKAEKKARKRGE